MTARSWRTWPRWRRASSGDDSERAYRAAFDLAVARGFYQEAEPIARAYLAKEQGEPETHALAESIALISRADRGEFDQSLADLKGFLQSRAAAQVPDDRRLPAALVCAMGEAYLQRLIRGGRLDIAKEVCRLASTSNHPDRVVDALFRRAARPARNGRQARPHDRRQRRRRQAGPPRRLEGQGGPGRLLGHLVPAVPGDRSATCASSCWLTATRASR